MIKFLKKVNVFALIGMFTLGLLLTAFTSKDETSAFQESRGVLAEFDANHWQVTSSTALPNNCGDDESLPCTITLDPVNVQPRPGGILVIPKTQASSPMGEGPYQGSE